MCIFDDTCKRDNKNETITCNFELMIQFCNAVTATYFTATYNYSLSILIKTKFYLEKHMYNDSYSYILNAQKLIVAFVYLNTKKFIRLQPW